MGYVEYGTPRAVRALIVGTTIAYGVQLLSDRLAGGAVSPLGFTDTFALSAHGFRHGRIWQPLTYMFLHGGLWHLLLNMLGLYVFGRGVEEDLGPGRTTGLYLACGLAGAAGWLALSGAPFSRCLGASGAVMGLMGAAAAMHPQRTITLLVMFVLPVTLTLRTLAIVLSAVSVAMLLASDGNVAHAAHLAGGLAGYLYGLRRGRGAGAGLAGRLAAWRASRRRRGWRVVGGAENAPPAPEEVDAILDKIRCEGMGRLTRRERATLERAARAGRGVPGA